MSTVFHYGKSPPSVPTDDLESTDSTALQSASVSPFIPEKRMCLKRDGHLLGTPHHHSRPQLASAPVNVTTSPSQPGLPASSSVNFQRVDFLDLAIASLYANEVKKNSDEF